ncbi:MAG: ABC transporter ATP-binding protein [Candidatus Thiodiazotropha sp.]
MKPAVRCRGLAKSYGEGSARVAALRGLDLEVQAGELLMLVGPSGCGKTTLISILAAILAADEGECEVLGRDLRRMNEADKVAFRRKSVGFVFQTFNLLPALTAVENVALPLLIAGVPRAAALSEARRRVESVGLAARAEALPGRLSGGQQQRIAIARALIHDPELLICDEPTSSLDHTAGSDMMKLLRNTGRTGHRALVVVTHDTRIVEFGDRVVHMDDGRVVAAGEGSEQGAI